MNTKSPLWTRKFPPNYLHSNQVDTWNIFWDDEICDEKLPRENPEKSQKWKNPYLNFQ